MIRVCHVLNGLPRWEHRVALRQLLRGMPPKRVEAFLAAPGLTLRSLALELGEQSDGLTIPRGPAFPAGLVFAHNLRRRSVDLIHAWGVQAAAIARMAGDAALVVHLCDPALSRQDINLLRSIARPERFAIVCTAATIRRRLIEGGVPPEICVVIRPGVEFDLINETRRAGLREHLGIRRDETMVLLPEPVCHSGGHFEAFRAASLWACLARNRRIILPGCSREARRIVTYNASLPIVVGLVATADSVPFERLVAISDVLLLAPQESCPTTAIGWAMAARAAVVSTAVYSVAELIAHKVNGLLVKPQRGRSLVQKLASALFDEAAMGRVRETAYGQAYEIFSVRRSVELVLQLYENIVAGLVPGTDIEDTASVG